jgi:hypothetical protein
VPLRLNGNSMNKQLLMIMVQKSYISLTDNHLR